MSQQTAKRRRRQMRMRYAHIAVASGRPMYKKRSSETQARKLARNLEKLRTMANRKTAKK